MDLRTAAARLGVHYQTAYRWVRDGSLPAVKVGQAYEVRESDLERFLQRRSRPIPPPPRLHVRRWAPLAERFHAALVTGEEARARSVAERLLDGGVPVVDICERLLAPALHRIGDAWAEGSLTVAEEHRAAAICERLLSRAAGGSRGRPRGVCVVACPAGERHGLPSLMAAAALRSDRWQVHHLGADVPADALVHLTAAVEADLVVLSTVFPDCAAAVHTVVRLLERRTGARILVGHPGAVLGDLLREARAA